MSSLTKTDISNGSENRPIVFEDDELTHNLKDFQYVCCNIPGPGTNRGDFEETLQGCTCSGQSCDLSAGTECSCMKYGSSYMYDGRLNMISSSDIEKAVINECNTFCGCTKSCSNRVVQHGITVRLEVFWSSDKGYCLRTLEPIKKGRFVCEYAGEVLTRNEAGRRVEQQSKDDMNYIFVLNEHVASGILTTYIDPCYIGNVGRFVNHSCDPNLIVCPVRVHNFVPKVCLFAARCIDANEELTYNYGQSQIQEKVNLDRPKKICKCNSDLCKGFLPFDLTALL